MTPDTPEPPKRATEYRLPTTGRLINVAVSADAPPPFIHFEVAPGHVVVAIRADLKEPF
jgi:hypothetical protein